jgi:hypothetical protein
MSRFDFNSFASTSAAAFVAITATVMMFAATSVPAASGLVV